MTTTTTGAIGAGDATAALDPADWLARFVATRDEAAFAALVAIHGPMVLATCRRISPHQADADDAFQATFLVLARRAGSIRDPARLAPWLHRVARHVALRARKRAARRRAVEGPGAGASEVATLDPPGDLGELRPVLDEELARLPARHRAALVACYLDGLTHDEAAARLGWPVGTVRSRLARGRDRLRARLARRGFGPASAALPPVAPLVAVPRPLQLAAARLALAATSRVAASPAALLAHGVPTAMTLAHLQPAAAVLAVAAALAAGTAGAVLARQRPADPPGAAPAPAAPGGIAAPEVAGPGRALAALRERVRVERGRIERAAQERRSRNPSGPPPVATSVDAALLGIAAAELEIAGATPRTDLADDEQYASELQALRDRAAAEVGAIRAAVEAIKLAGAGTPAGPLPATEVDALKARIKALEAELARRDEADRAATGQAKELEAQTAAAARAVAAARAELPRPERPVPDPPAPGESIPEQVSGLLKEVDALAGEVRGLEIEAPPGLTTGKEPFRTDAARTPPAGPGAAPQPAPAPTVETLEGSPTILMVTSAARDRVTMIDLATRRRATLRLGRPMALIRAVANHSGLPPLALIEAATADQLREGRMVDGLVGLEVAGERVESVAVFDRVAMQWFEHPLPRPATRVRPDLASSSTLVGFGLEAPGPTPEVIAFDARDHSWPTVGLPAPAAGIIAVDVSTFGTVTYAAGRSLAIYSQAARKATAIILERAPAQPRGQEPRLGRVDASLRNFREEKLVITDGNLIRIFDPKTAEWTTIDTATEK